MTENLVKVQEILRLLRAKGYSYTGFKWTQYHGNNAHFTVWWSERIRIPWRCSTYTNYEGKTREIVAYDNKVWGPNLDNIIEKVKTLPDRR